jgi:putative DNA primase/helicase
VRLAGDEDAWMRRIEIIEFPNPRDPGSEVIDNFEELLVREEGEGILAWMIEGALKHWSELLAHKGFTATPAQTERVTSLIARSKSIETFVRTNLTKDSMQNITVEELYNAYTSFCVKKGWTSTSEHSFQISSRHLIMQHWGSTQRNDVERNGKAKCGYVGLDLICQAAPDDHV